MFLTEPVLIRPNMATVRQKYRKTMKVIDLIGRARAIGLHVPTWPRLQ